MQLVPISLFDHLSFSANNREGVNFSMSGACEQVEIGEENLVLRAIRAFEKASALKVHQTIHLEKNIPVGAGLGGGSGNAAGALHALNSLYSSPLSNAALLKIAEDLGSDVPFFINPTPCLATGRGEKLEALEDYKLFPLIVFQPEFSISTAKAYQWVSKKFLKILQKTDIVSPHEQGISCWSNQFESVLFQHYPLLLKIKDFLVENGAFAALVSGSGSSIFGVFKEHSQQQHGLDLLLNEFSGRALQCEMLQHHQYLQS